MINFWLGWVCYALAGGEVYMLKCSWTIRKRFWTVPDRFPFGESRNPDHPVRPE